MAGEVHPFTSGIFDGIPNMSQNLKHTSTDPIACPFKALPPVSLQLVSQSGLETFVDPQRFKGTSYKAANWHLLSTTHGSGKQEHGYVFQGNKKEIYAYVLVLYRLFNV